MDNIIQQVINWAEERNLANPSDLHAETLMLVTKFGQLASSINKLEESKDLIGRCIIEMIIICKMHNIAFVDCLNLTKEIKDQEITQPKHVLNKILKTLGILSENILAKKNFKTEIGYLLIYLSAISHNFDFSMMECLEVSFNKIKNKNIIKFNGAILEEGEVNYDEARRFLEVRTKTGKQITEL